MKPTREEFIREHYDYVLAFLTGLTEDPSRAEALARETFLRALRPPGSLLSHPEPRLRLAAIAGALYRGRRKPAGRPGFRAGWGLVGLAALILAAALAGRAVFSLWGDRVLDERGAYTGPGAEEQEPRP